MRKVIMIIQWKDWKNERKKIKKFKISQSSSSNFETKVSTVSYYKAIIIAGITKALYLHNPTSSRVKIYRDWLKLSDLKVFKLFKRHTLKSRACWAETCICAYWRSEQKWFPVSKSTHRYIRSDYAAKCKKTTPFRGLWDLSLALC